LKYLLGFDIGSSSVKAALIDAYTGKLAASAFSPATEIRISSPQSGFAEQDPGTWWSELINATRQLKKNLSFQPGEILAIGIAYQMHGLVCLDKQKEVLRPSIIWCDSRAVDIGNQAFMALGESFCLQNFLNSPGNFTASKLKWVKENEPALYEKIDKILLPGDYIAWKLTGEATTTVPGLSEAILWNFQTQSLATELLDYYHIDKDLLPSLVPTFGEQGKLQADAAAQLELFPGIPVSYRAGDQPNNAFSLNVLNPGELAATAGTSGVVYAVNDKAEYDPQSRVNSFVHVNSTPENPRLGVLLCVNGTGILNSWLKTHFFANQSYSDLNKEAAAAPIGSDGLYFYPFGNGAERVLSNKDLGASLRGLQFNRHGKGHILRAAQEGIVFALTYGMEIMQKMGISLTTVRAGYANMFLSEVFTFSFANATGCQVELYNTDGAQGAARGAGLGIHWYSNFESCFKGLDLVKKIDPDERSIDLTREIYLQWKKNLSFITQ